MIDAVEEAFRALGVKPMRREGEPEAGWWLLDYVDVVVHVFGEEERAYYDLERLWSRCARGRVGTFGRRRDRPIESPRRGPIAQLVERLAGSQEVRGSTPLGSTDYLRRCSHDRYRFHSLSPVRVILAAPRLTLTWENPRSHMGRLQQSVVEQVRRRPG